MLTVADRIGNIDVFDADHGAEIAALNGVGLLAPDAFKGEKLFDLSRFGASVPFDDRQRFAGVERAAVDAPDADPADEVGVIQRGDLREHRPVDLRRGRDEFQNRVEQRENGTAFFGEVAHGPAVAAAGVKQRKIELIVAGVEFAEEVEDLVVNLIGPGIGFVDLVDDDHGAQIEPERLVEDEPRLRHRSLGGVDQEKHAVGEFENPFDLAAEIAVSGGVDDVDLGILVFDADVFGKDGDSAFAFEVVVVEEALGDDFVFAEDLRLMKNLVDEGGLAVVDVSDDRNVS